MARTLVLDRSYLESSKGSAVEALCDAYQVIMPEALFFEMFTAKEGKTPVLFRKLPDRDNPVAFVTHVGTLLRYEIESNKSAGPVEKLALHKRFEFNPRLRAGDFVLTPEQEVAMSQWSDFRRESAKGFLERYSCAHNWFPGTDKYVPGRPDDVIRAAKNRVARDPLLIGRIYEEIRPQHSPATAQIGPEWALYRWLQVQLVYALEYIKRHGAGKSDLVAKSVPSDVIDAQYVTTALLANGLASDDATIKEIFQLLNPTGELRTNQ